MTATERWYARSNTPDNPDGVAGCEIETDDGSRTAMEIWFDRPDTPSSDCGVGKELFNSDGYDQMSPFSRSTPHRPAGLCATGLVR